MLPVIQAGVPWAARSAGPAGRRGDDRGQPRLLLHIACQAGGQIPARPPATTCAAPRSVSCSPVSHRATGRMAQPCARSALRLTTQQVPAATTVTAVVTIRPAPKGLRLDRRALNRRSDTIQANNRAFCARHLLPNDISSQNRSTSSSTELPPSWHAAR